MNVVAHPVAETLATLGQPKVLNIEQAHIFRSKVIGKCAAVESWLTEQISIVEKPEMMLSQKMEQLKKLTSQGKVDFKHPQKLQDRLQTFRQFSDFRSEIAHSEMTLSLLDGVATIIFENANQTCPKMLRKRILIAADEVDELWKGINSAVQALITLKAISPTLSPTQGK